MTIMKQCAVCEKVLFPSECYGEVGEPLCWTCYSQLMDEMEGRGPERDERGLYEWSYGHFGAGDPRDFTPDYELCTPEEIARWKADVARAESGETVVAPPAGGWNEAHTIHILAPKYGIGTYKYRLDERDIERDENQSGLL